MPMGFVMFLVVGFPIWFAHYEGMVSILDTSVFGGLTFGYCLFAILQTPIMAMIIFLILRLFGFNANQANTTIVWA